MDPVIKKETGYIAAGTAALSALVQIVWAIFFKYDYTVFLGGLWGGAFAIGNFVLLGVTVQKAQNDQDEMLARRRVHASYQFRLMLLGAMIIVAFLAPIFNWVMAAASLVFPRLTILFEPLFREELRKKGGKE